MRKTPTIRRSRFRWTWLAMGAVLLFALALAACGGDDDDESDHQDDHAEAGDEEVVTNVYVVRASESGASLAVELGTTIQDFDDVVQVEPYIRLRFEGFDIVGVDFDGLNRIMTGQPSPQLIEASLTEGAALDADSAAARQVLVGQSYADAAGLALGAAFQLAESDLELQVAGIFSTQPSELSSTIIMPLALVQEIYGLPDQVTHFWVTLESPSQTHDAIRVAQLALGDDVAVLPRTVG